MIEVAFEILTEDTAGIAGTVGTAGIVSTAGTAAGFEDTHSGTAVVVEGTVGTVSTAGTQNTVGRTADLG